MNQVRTHSTFSLVLLLIIACAGHFIVDFMLGIWPVFKTIAGLDIGICGIIAAVCVISGEGMQLVFGPLSDKGYQKLLLLLGPLFAAACVFFPYGSSYGYFLLLFLGTCLGSSAFHPTAVSVLNGLSSKRRGLIMGIFATAGMLGISLSQIVFSWSYIEFEGKTWFLMIPSCILACLLLGTPIKKHIHHVPSAEAPSIKMFWRFFQTKELRCLYCTLLTNQIILWAFIFLLPDFLVSREYPEWVSLGGGHMVLMIGAACASIPLGYIADKTCPKKIIVTTFCLTILSLYALLIFGAFHTQIVLCLLFLLGGSMGAVMPLSLALGNELVPGNRGTISAFLMGCVWIVSESFGIGVSGILADSFGQDAPAKALACVGSVLFIGMYFVLRLPTRAETLLSQETQKQETTAPIND